MSFGLLRRFGVAATLVAGILGASAFAQEQSNSTKPTTPVASQPAAPAPHASSSASSLSASSPTKRVWTNDDMGDLHRNSTISSFSAPPGKSGNTNGKPATGAKNSDAKRYQDQIAALRAKLPPIDDKISQLQAVLSGNTVQEMRSASGAHIDDWHEELLHLQKQREDIEAKISALQDEARHNGVPDNQIPQGR
jgi:hypothetical protein